MPSPEALSFWLTRRWCDICRRWRGLLYRTETEKSELRCPGCGGATEDCEPDEE